MSDDVYSQIAVKIISEQELIIGPVAIEQAKQVAHLKVDWAEHSVSIEGNQASVIDALVEKYKELFGQISVEVCRNAASGLVGKIPTENMPSALK